MSQIKIGLASQDKEYLQRILDTMNSVKSNDKSEFHYKYKAELIWRINGGDYDEILKEINEKERV